MSNVNKNQLDRFSSGFYSYDLTDRILLKVINGRVPKHLRGNELKKMAILYLANNEPDLYARLLEECTNEMQSESQNSVAPIVFPTRTNNIEINNTISEKNNVKIAPAVVSTDEQTTTNDIVEEVSVTEAPAPEEKPIPDEPEQIILQKEDNSSSYFNQRSDVNLI